MLLHFLSPFILCIFHSATGQVLQNRLIADPNEDYHIFWTTEGDSIIFELQVRTKGYIGFGFSPNGGMTGSDVIIGWVLPNGTTHFRDRHATGYYEPVLDEVQNYELLKGYENETHTILRFKRKLITCDNDDISVTDDTMKVIYSWHPEDPPSSTGLTYHGRNRRGSKSVLLLSPQPPPIQMTADMVTWDVQIPNLTIPAQLTTYWCYIVKYPYAEERHDYLGYTIKMTPGNEEFVHHFVLWECRGNSSHFEQQAANTKGYECVEEDSLASPMECQPPIIVWAVGAQGQVLPKDVGVPFGEKFGGPSYLQIQMHYTNPDKKTGIVDNSGLTLYFTKKPSKLISGMLQIYSNFDYTLSMPPKQPDFRVAAYCPSECTKSAIPAEGITVYAVGLHSHLAGRKLSVQHFRGDQELKPIAIDNHYAFDFQDVRQLTATVKILPGDVLMANCSYSTMDRNQSVTGGYSTYQEMCYAYLYYYPALPLSICMSGPTFKETADYYGVQLAEDSIHITSPAQYQNQSIFQFIRNFDWSKVSEEKLNKLRQMQFEGEQTVTCLDSPPTKEGTSTLKVRYPPNAKSYVAPPDVCTSTSQEIYSKPKYNYYGRPTYMKTVKPKY